MVCVLLYSARLEPSFWSYALVHSVYIKNWLWHSALRRTLIETLTGAPPDLSHLRVFGSKVRACKPGQPRAKVNDHVYDGVFLGFRGTSSTIVYYDVRTGTVKTPVSFLIDEAHYSSSCCSPGLPLLYKLGLPSAPSVTSLPDTATLPSKTVVLPVPYPPVPAKLFSTTLPTDVTLLPLPIAEVAPTPPAAAAAAACVLPDIVSVRDVMSISLSGDPFGPSFRETIPVHGDHPTLGFVLQCHPDRCRLRLVDCAKGTPAHCLHHWCSRLRHSFLWTLMARLLSRWLMLLQLWPLPVLRT